MDGPPASREIAEGSSKGERTAPDFEALPASCRSAVERCVYYRLPSRADADDILQEAYLAAYQNFHTLDDPAAFKPGILRIARSKYRDCFQSLSKALEIPLWTGRRRAPCPIMQL
ncbi:MAG TPA: sigma-70 family RNA polymerase sigma factor [Firmicutes bacterium]|nr:sigma-70 family RNA polymerase sigma factor [Bacillota bacterium]